MDGTLRREHDASSRPESCHTLSGRLFRARPATGRYDRGFGIGIQQFGAFVSQVLLLALAKS
jgi:hypothetical protein